MCLSASSSTLLLMSKGEPMNDFAWQFSESLAGAVDKAAAGVVRIHGRRRRPSSAVIWSSGVLVTTHHVLEWEEDIEVGLPDGNTTTASVVGRDPSTDLAALRVSEATPEPPEWGDAGEVKAGHLVMSLSRPGRKIWASLGIVGSPANPGAPPWAAGSTPRSRPTSASTPAFPAAPWSTC